MTAKQILAQLGGNKFVVMTGSKNFVGDTNSLRMQLTKNALGAKWLVITLNSMDTYDLEFSKPTKILDENFGIKVDGVKSVKTIEGIYADTLREVFERETGLRTSL